MPFLCSYNTLYLQASMGIRLRAEVISVEVELPTHTIMQLFKQL